MTADRLYEYGRSRPQLAPSAPSAVPKPRRRCTRVRDDACRETESLGRRFARARKESGRTQAEIAEALGWKSQSMISQLERGSGKTYLGQLDRWAAVLGKRIILVDLDDTTGEGTADARPGSHPDHLEGEQR